MINVNTPSKHTPIVLIPVSVFFGVLIGLLTLALIKSLEAVEVFHLEMNKETPYHLMLAPAVLLLIIFIKKNTLFFPTSVAQLPEERNSSFWSIIVTPINIMAAFLGHLSGMSLGREGTAVVASAGMVRTLRLDWKFWGPIFSAAGFSAVVGSYWVSVVFMQELFGRTSNLQKICCFIVSVSSVLMVKTYHHHELIKIYNFETDMGFFKKLIFLLFFAACAGYLIRFYKKMHAILVNHFSQKSLVYKLSIVALLAACLYLPEFRKFQSLGLLQLESFQAGSITDAILKLYFTVITTSIGFIGGEFIPLVYAGVHFGSGFFTFFGENGATGAVLGTYLLFACASRVKWTSYILVLSLMGFSWWFWSYLVIAFAMGFSGDRSIYKNSYQNL